MPQGASVYGVNGVTLTNCIITNADKSALLAPTVYICRLFDCCTVTDSTVDRRHANNRHI